MKVEVRCPDCTHSWLVDERARRGEMICPQCMARIPLANDRRPETPSVATPPAFAGSDVGSVSAAVAAPPRAEVATEVAAEVSTGEVVCPRCKLHFHPSSQPAAETTTRRKVVLVVEDLEYFRQIAADALRPTFEVKTAKTRDEARSILARRGVDCLVLDLTLDGCDAGRQLLTELRPKPCPILIFTAQDETDMYGDYWQELTALGADDLVIKGMKVAEVLARKVSELLDTPLVEE